jgi:hypothetical protein
VGTHNLNKVSAAGILIALGIIYGDIGTSPLYVFSAIINGKLLLTYTTLCGDVPKHDIGLQPGGKSDAPLSTWFDDIRVAPLP